MTSQSLSLDEILQQAVFWHQSGQLSKAAQIYQCVLKAQPDHSDAHHNLGILALQTEQRELALLHLKAALEGNPGREQYWISYANTLISCGEFNSTYQVLTECRKRGLHGNALETLENRLKNALFKTKSSLVTLFNQGKYDEAEKLAASLSNDLPKDGFCWKLLGSIFKQQGRLGEAVSTLNKARELLPDDEEIHNNLGVTLRNLKRLSEAESCYRRALEINRDSAVAYNNMAVCLREQARYDEAIIYCQKALQLEPDNAGFHTNLGNVRKAENCVDQAIACYRRALQINPNFTEALNNLGTVLKSTGQISDAEACYRRSLETNPRFAEAHSNLGVILQDQGYFGEAVVSFRRALAIKPDYIEAYSNLIYCFNLMGSQITPIEMLSETQQFGTLVVQKIQPYRFWENPPEPARCLRVGLVSGDFINHPVSHFLESVLSTLQITCIGRLELHAYNCSPRSDEVTTRIKACCHAWHEAGGWSDEFFAQKVRAGGIDILVDLAGHTAYNRLPMFAWKPAPVQVSWLGYFATTGVAAMDYVIADPWALPIAEEKYFTERIWRLPESRLCFTPPDFIEDVAPLPALSNGFVTFGCFNNLAKMNDEVVALWAQVLAAVPGSCLFLKAIQLGEHSVRQRTLNRFSIHGVGAERLILEGPNSRSSYLASFHRVDIALDPFPFPGGTTSIEGMWMGVPVLTLNGDRFISRQGVGILANVKLNEWIAADAEDYIARAVLHTKDLQRLASLRQELRQRVLSSPICDAPRFSRHLETAFRHMWQVWCGQQQSNVHEIGSGQM